MQKYLMKFSSRGECIDYLNYLKGLGSSKILFYYLTSDVPHIPLFVNETDTECAIEVNAAFNGDPPDGFMDHVEIFAGFDPDGFSS
jgi:hypothetical protein